QEERHGSFSGIGIQIGIRDKKLTVIAPIEDTPAHRAGLKSGDHILGVDGKPTKDMAIEEAVSLIRGQRGTKVKLLIERNGTPKPFNVSIVRDNIVTEAVKTKEIDSSIGYIRLASFMSETTTQEMKAALEKFKDKKALILDLRGNPGGLLPNAIDIGMLFVDKGPIVQIVDRDGNKEKLPDNDTKGRPKLAWPKSKPLVVLVDGGSASASEILSGALQDSHTAILIGTKTFGKGLVQTVHALDGGAGIAITTNKYLTAGGSDINKLGIVPDLIQWPMKLSELPKAKNDAEELSLEARKGYRDLQLDKAVAYLKGKLGQGPEVLIPSRGSATAESNDEKEKAASSSALLPEVPKILNFNVIISFEPGKENLLGSKGELELASTLNNLSAKLRGLTSDQLEAIAKHRDFQIHISGDANQREDEAMAIRRAEHVAAFIRGFFLNMGFVVEPKRFQIEKRQKEAPVGSAELKIQLPYGEVLLEP
ncbi:MAG: PDZ domain-containing protein, partial [Cyanobacteria bacterium NC_groundwater_1444_Ag_S-0.65um_54_12]|nr:PDZ domain-containing protein [Cyanobacteria bacterium NC_groundwater_1444_Ag_S-0.65um_54_12]